MCRAMGEPFNAYQAWLGIPRDEQPPHHYQLLGLRVFESNRQAIEAAPERVAVRLRDFQWGPNQAIAEQLILEVRTAAACLLDADYKARYDRALALGLALDDIGVSPQALVDAPTAPVQQAESAISPAALDYVQRLVQPAAHSAAVIDAEPVDAEPQPEAAWEQESPTVSIAATTAPARPMKRAGSIAWRMHAIMALLGGIVGLSVGYFAIYYLLGEDLFRLWPPREPLLPAYKRAAVQKSTPTKARQAPRSP